MPHLYSYMCYYPKCLKTIRMNGLKSRAAGRHVLSNSSSVSWRMWQGPHCSGQNANGYHRELRPTLPIAFFPPASLYDTFTHAWPTILSLAFLPIRPLRSLQSPANDITKAQSECWAGDTEAQTGWI